MSKKLTMAIIVVLLAVVVIGVAVYYISSNNDSENGYTLSFESNGGSEVSPISFDENSPIAAPLNPTKSGSEFIGWYSDENLTAPYMFDKAPSKSTKLFAKWAEVIDIDDEDWKKITSDPSIINWNLGSSQIDSIAISGSDILNMKDYLETIILTVSNGHIVLDIENLNEDNAITSSSVFKFSISEGNKTALSDEEADIIGDRPFYSVILAIDDNEITDPDDFITLYLDYSLKDGEDASNLQVYSLSNSGSAKAVYTDYLFENNFVECDPNNSLYYIISYDGLLWPDMFGISIPKASVNVESYLGSNLFDLLINENDAFPSELLKYVDVSKLNWEIQSVSVDDYNESEFGDYVKSLKSNGFEQYPFSEAVSTDIHTWIGVKSVNGVSYIIIAKLNDLDIESFSETDEPSTRYFLHDDYMSVVLLNFDPLNELGVSVTKSESYSEEWMDTLAGFSIPAPYPNSGFENLVELDFSGSSLSGLFDKILIRDNISNEGLKCVESFLNGLSDIKCKIGYINTIDKSGQNLTHDVVWQEINKIKEQNNLMIISAAVDDGHYSSPVILAKTLEVVNGKFMLEDLVIISFNEWSYTQLGYNPEMKIFAINASLSMDLNDVSISGFELNTLQFNEPWVEDFAGFKIPEPYSGATVDYRIDMNIDISKLLGLLNAAFPDPSMTPEYVLVIEEIMNSYKDLSGTIGVTSFTSPDFNLETAKKFVQDIANANSLTIVDDESDTVNDGYSWIMFKKLENTDPESVVIEGMVSVTWTPYELGGIGMYDIQITSMDAKFTISHNSERLF